MKENQHIEFKQSWRDEYLQYICGFANAQGGTLYIGIDDKGEVCGIKNAHSLLENLPNQINQTIEQWGRGYEKIHDAFVRERLLVQYIREQLIPNQFPCRCNMLISFCLRFYVHFSFRFFFAYYCVYVTTICKHALRLCGISRCPNPQISTTIQPCILAVICILLERYL